MSRIRTIKPEFWTSEQIVECSTTARLLFIGIWNFCDDGGNHPVSFKTLKMQIFPGDDDISCEKISGMVSELISHDLLVEYEAEGKKYWHVSGWHHQKIDKPNTKYPKFDDRSTTVRRPFHDQSPEESKGKERIVREESVKELRAFSEFDLKVFEKVKTKFGISELNHFENFKELNNFISVLSFRKRLEHFSKQFDGYISYKKIAEEQEHGFKKYLGSPEKLYEDGGWNAEDWSKKLIDFQKKKIGITHNNGKTQVGGRNLM